MFEFKLPDLGEGDFVILEVHDTGIGMDEEGLARVFEPFYSTKPGRSGLGIPAVVGCGEPMAIRLIAFVEICLHALSGYL